MVCVDVNVLVLASLRFPTCYSDGDGWATPF